MNSTYRETGKNTISLSNLFSFVHIKQRKVPDSMRFSPKRCLCPWPIITYTCCHHVITLTHISKTGWQQIYCRHVATSTASFISATGRAVYIYQQMSAVSQQLGGGGGTLGYSYAILTWPG